MTQKLFFLAFSSTAIVLVSVFIAIAPNLNCSDPHSRDHRSSTAEAETTVILPAAADGGGRDDHHNNINSNNTERLLGLRLLEIIPVDGGAYGPESFAFDPRGEGPYTGVSDGRILKWVAPQRKWIDFAFASPHRQQCQGREREDHEELEHFCGRPLGLCFNRITGDLYVADAYMGLGMVGPGGGLVAPVHGIDVPLGFANGLDIDQQTGIVYFTDSSTRYSRRNYVSAIVSGDTTGRLMKYNPDTKQTDVLVESLSFPNGVAVTRDGGSILVAESSRFRILRYCLRRKTWEVFARVPGFPDNIKASPRGGYWVGIYTRKGKLLDWILFLLSRPRMGRATLLTLIPVDYVRRLSKMYGRWRGRGLAVRLSEQGRVLEVVEGGIQLDTQWKSISEVVEVRSQGSTDTENTLWIGSVNLPFSGAYQILNVTTQIN